MVKENPPSCRRQGLPLLTCLWFISLCAAGLLLAVAADTGTVTAGRGSGDGLETRPVTSTLEARLFLPLISREYCMPTVVPDDASLFGTVFFDYNGDGARQSTEPGIRGAQVTTGGQSVTAGCDGVFFFRGLPAATYDVTIAAVGFRYLSLSASEFRSIDSPVEVTTSGNTRRDFGLMQGFLTLPFHRAAGTYVQEYFDYDPAYYNYLWWNGQRGIGIARNHSGTDLGVPQDGVPVVAPAPARVRETWADPNGGWCLNAEVADTTIYWVCHMRLAVAANQMVKRGDLLGYVDFPSAPHVHLSVGYLRSDDGWHFDIQDIYVPADPSICGEWRYPIGISADPEFVRSACSPGYWTVKNSPQPFD